jgi:hypothetical protein
MRTNAEDLVCKDFAFPIGFSMSLRVLAPGLDFRCPFLFPKRDLLRARSSVAARLVSVGGRPLTPAEVPVEYFTAARIRFCRLLPARDSFFSSFLSELHRAPVVELTLSDEFTLRQFIARMLGTAPSFLVGQSILSCCL